MDIQAKLTLEEAHQLFGRQANGAVWQLLGQAERTAEEGDRLLEAAWASLYHWRLAGTALHLQRGEWLLAHVYTELGEAAPAVRHAQRCLDLTAAHKDLMHDFDLAYGYEGLARALALAGRLEEAHKYLLLAQAAGETIADPEDKQIFDGDFNRGEWYGIRSGQINIA